MRTGVFGGTFDPIHNGHLAIARAAKEEAALDRVLFVVAANPPHKKDNRLTAAPAPGADDRAAIAEERGFQISLIEIERRGYSFTVDTLKSLGEEDPGGELFFILGYDSALDLPHWRDARLILDLATLLVAPRPFCADPLPALLRDRAILLKTEPWDISSSDIRSRIRKNEQTDHLLPPSVLDIIRKKRLYQPCP